MVKVEEIHAAMEKERTEADAKLREMQRVHASEVAEFTMKLPATQAELESERKKYAEDKRRIAQQMADLESRLLSPSKAEPAVRLVEVTLAVRGCDGLLEPKDRGSSDDIHGAFVIVFDGNGTEVYRTPMSDSSLNPRWGPEHLVRLPINAAKPDGSVELQVWSWNEKKNSFRGAATIPVASLLQRPGTTTASLRPRPKENDAEILRHEGAGSPGR
jgi:hypothetical protein